MTLAREAGLAAKSFRQVLRTVMIAPARYENGSVAVFRIGIGPNGALGALAGLAEDYNRRQRPTAGSTTSSSTSTSAGR